MKKYFWREKNAEFQIGKFEVVAPTSEQLFDELVKKIYEKIEMIDVIFDENQRRFYLRKKGKIIDDNIPEIVIQQKIGTRVIVDFLQLVKDVCELKSIKVKSTCRHNKIEKEKIKLTLENAILELKTNDRIEIGIDLIYDVILSLAETLSLKYEVLEMERQKVEDLEGSFYNGKYVLMD